MVLVAVMRDEAALRDEKPYSMLNFMVEACKAETP